MNTIAQGPANGSGKTTGVSGTSDANSNREWQSCMVDLSLLQQSASAVKSTKPRPLIQVERAEEYPVASLPPLIRDAIYEVASYVKAPLAMIAASALSAVSTAVQTRYSVQRDSALSGPATLYLLTVAESGERKSTVDKMFTGPIRDWEAEQVKRLREQRAQYKAQLEDWERQAETLQKNFQMGFQSVQPGQLDPRVVHDLAKPQEPKLVRLLRDDDTPEALAMALADYPVASVISAEAGTIFGSHGMKAEAVMGNLAQANQMWDGGIINQSRVSREAIRVEGMRVTMGLQVQPAVLDAFVAKSGNLATGIGYFSRFLFSHPESTQGSRYYDAAPVDRPALRAFCNRMTELLNVEAEFDEYGRLRPTYVTFDQEAHHVWVGFHDEVEESLGGDYLYSGIKGVASKAADNAARLACCAHVFSSHPGAPVAPISVRAMVGACHMMRWYLDEAVRFGRTSDMAPEVGDAQMLEEWLVREVKNRGRDGGSVVITVNDVRKKGPNKLRQARSKKLDDALELLSDHHRISVLKRPGTKSTDIAVRAEVMAEYD